MRKKASLLFLAFTGLVLVSVPTIALAGKGKGSPTTGKKGDIKAGKKSKGFYEIEPTQLYFPASKKFGKKGAKDVIKKPKKNSSKPNKEKANSKQCELSRRTKTTKECKRQQKRREQRNKKPNIGQKLPLCVGLRGNGPRLFAHFTAIARVVESIGVVDGMAGGSSSTVTSFVHDSIQSNDLVRYCGKNRCCSDAERRARISFLLKSLQAGPQANILSQQAIIQDIQERVQNAMIVERLESGNVEEQLQAVQDLILIFQDSELLNEEVADLLQNSPDPVFHASDILTALSGDFSVNGDPLVVIRPYPINFQTLAYQTDIVASFYRGYPPANLEALQRVLKECAVPSLGLLWEEIQSLPLEDGSTCGEMMVSLFEEYSENRVDEDPSRLDDFLGEGITALITTSLLQGEAYEIWKEASEQYFNADVPVDFQPSFDDVKFGYFGEKKALERVSRKLPKLFDDIKSNKYLSLGPATWNKALTTSPAEPTLSRGVPLGDDRVSTGGWCDPTPAQVLTAMGCEKIVLINRPGGIGTFSIEMAEILGASEDDLDGLFDLEDKRSSFATALRSYDGTICADWDAPDSGNITALSLTGSIGPFISDDKCVLSLAEEATDDVEIVGCTPA